MKILWLGGIVLPRIAEQEKMKVSYANGWLISLSEKLSAMHGIDLTYVFDSPREIKGSTVFYSYYGIKNTEHSYNRLGEAYISQAITILKQVNPDVVHIWGTERSHTLAMVDACERIGILDRVVISIQGLVSAYSYHYDAYLPHNVTTTHTVKDIVQGNIDRNKRRFQVRGEYEKEALRKVKHVIGRTDWDRGCLWNINPKAIYHFNNETLREEFYTGEWDLERCEKYSIFCSQGHYPIKGIHLAISAMPRIIEEFPDAKLYIGGKDYTKVPYWKRNGYENYIVSLINKSGLSGKVEFTGFLSAAEMKNRYLRSNLFLTPSSIENSPNSLGEAMILGLPCVSSAVGGVHNLMTHNSEGYIYPADEVYLISYYVCDLFRDEDRAAIFGQEAAAHAKKTHDEKINRETLIEIYRTIGTKE